MKRFIGIMVGNRLLLLLAAIPMISLLVTSCGDTDTPQSSSISGQVSIGGTGLSDVTMILSGAASATVATDASGNYTFSGLANGSYTVTPTKSSLSFSPINSSQTVRGADISAVNFTATAIPTSRVSGTVTSAGSALAGVTMMLSGAGSATATTDASGNYTFNGVANGNYTITPGSTGFAFSPASSAQTVSGLDITAVNFSAAPVSTFSIFGTVSSGGSGLSDVVMILSGAGSAAATTDANGNYIFSGLANGSYTITPGKAGFTFSPTSSSQTVSGGNIINFNFTTASSQAQIVVCPSSGTTNLTIQDFSFAPPAVTVNVSGIVKWTNFGPSPHTVTSGTTPNHDGKFNSGNLGIGANVCVKFLSAGSHPYFSVPDPSMTGIVTVQ